MRHAVRLFAALIVLQLTLSLLSSQHLPMVPAVSPSTAAADQGDVYFPDRGNKWERRTPEQVGMNGRRLDAALRFAQEKESKAPRDLQRNHYFSFGREPHGEAIGPFKERGAMTGIVVRHGYLVAEWGEPKRVDMTFSVTKSFLSTTVGLARDAGLIGDVNDKVADTMPIEHFNTEHNRKITWDHLLRQTSDNEHGLRRLRKRPCCCRPMDRP